MEPFLSKSYLIPLLRRLRGAGAARVVEACKPAVGKLSSIKANRWPIQACQGPCQGTSGAGDMGDRQLPSEASSLALDLPRIPREEGEGNPASSFLQTGLFTKERRRQGVGGSGLAGRQLNSQSGGTQHCWSSHCDLLTHNHTHPRLLCAPWSHKNLSLLASSAHRDHDDPYPQMRLPLTAKAAFTGHRRGRLGILGTPQIPSLLFPS